MSWLKKLLSPQEESRGKGAVAVLAECPDKVADRCARFPGRERINACPECTVVGCQRRAG